MRFQENGLLHNCQLALKSQQGDRKEPARGQERAPSASQGPHIQQCRAASGAQKGQPEGMQKFCVLDAKAQNKVLLPATSAKLLSFLRPSGHKTVTGKHRKPKMCFHLLQVFSKGSFGSPVQPHPAEWIGDLLWIEPMQCQSLAKQRVSNSHAPASYELSGSSTIFPTSLCSPHTYTCPGAFALASLN